MHFKFYVEMHFFTLLRFCKKYDKINFVHCSDTQLFYSGDMSPEREVLMKKNLSVRLLTVLLALVITAVIGFVVNYFCLVPISIHSPGAWGFIALLLFVALFTCFCVSFLSEEIETMSVVIVFLILFVVYMAAWIGVSIAGSRLLNSDSYVNLIEVTDGSFEEDVIEATSDDIISVDVLTAERLGDRTISDITNSTLYEVDDEYNLIEYNGEWYRISPLNYGGFFKYFKANDDGIPGYVLVNAKTSEATLVQLEEGMKYSPSAYFSYDLSRHIHNQYPSYSFGTSFFEIDEEGVPYWVTGIYTPKIGLKAGRMIESALLTNAITGESTEYSLDELPSWVDHVASVSYLMERVYWHYEYVNGVINFSQNGIYRTSYFYRDDRGDEETENEYTPFDGYNSAVSKDGELYFYTGLTPANSSESNVGFLLISPRTGEVRYYASSGAEESSAQAAAEGIVQNLRYSASFPTVVNVDGIETYFMTLKDNAGLVQKYALCNVSNYSIVVEGDSIDEAIEKYRIEMGLIEADEGTVESEPESNPEETPTETEERIFAVDEVYEAEIDGYTYYVITSQNEDDEYVYLSSIENSYRQPVNLKTGTMVTVKYYDSTVEEGVRIVTSIEFN